jgi:hypothetical protein
MTSVWIQSWVCEFHPDDRGMVKEAYTELLLDGVKIFSGEMTLKRKHDSTSQSMVLTFSSELKEPDVQKVFSRFSQFDLFLIKEDYKLCEGVKDDIDLCLATK